MDRRIKYTKKIIKDSLINLLNQKEINKITVSEICSLADINRATFYRYYLDVYDLIEKIKDEFTKEIIVAINNLEENHSESEFVRKILIILLENKELVKVLFTVKHNLYFFNDILDITYNMCKNKWLTDLKTIEEEDIEYSIAFIFNGSLGVINYWIRNDFKDNVDKIANTIETLSFLGIRKYIYKK